MSGKYYESDFEEAVVQLLQQAGWTEYSCGSELHRRFTDTIYEKDMMAYLQSRYYDKDLSENDYQTIIANLRNIGGSTDFDASRNAFTLYRDGFDFQYSDSSKQPFKLEYIDFEDSSNNIYRVVNQFEMKYGTGEFDKRIPDVLLFINGIPVCIFELKNPTNTQTTIDKAHEQITVCYRRDIHMLLKYCALAVISDGSNNRLGTVFSPFEYFYAWKKVENEDKPGCGVAELETLINGALCPSRILEILRDYVYYPDPAENTTKEDSVVCRYPQFFATRKLTANILNHLRSVGGDGKGGTYFGATGCGKTYTMLFLARQLALRCKQQLGTPTILLIVDREDLENQAGKLFCKSTNFLCDDAVKVFESRKDLGNELRSRESGGFYITTIQKFEEEMGLLSNRSNIICMSDEAHRSQTNVGSKLQINTKSDDPDKIGATITHGFAHYLHDALPNATFVGFTGTPIDGTVNVFGGIVDSYTMRQSQEDGITVPLKYDPRLARVSLDEAQAKLIEQYYQQCESEGAASDDVDASKMAMSKLRVILNDDDRLRRVAKDIVTDYEQRCENQPDRLQKAMITCYDRDIAYKLYKFIEEIRPEWTKRKKALDESKLTKKELEQLNKVGYLEMIATRDKNDAKEMYEYLGDKEHRKELAKEYKNDKSNFHIAIVVDMWITGFDCPSLTFLYNDKPLQKHTLIQTISRVNRKYGKKEYGFIIDYIGILESMQKALKIYGGDDPTSGGNDVKKAFDIFSAELQILKELVPNVDFKPFFENDALKRLMFLKEVAELILAKSFEGKGKTSIKTQFVEHVKRMKMAYDICQPAGIVSKEDESYAQCFMGICSFVTKISGTQHSIESMNRAVEKMIKEALSCSRVETVINAQEEEDIFGDKFLNEINNLKMPNTKFQLLLKLLKRAIKEYMKTNKVRADHFDVLLANVVEEYNTRDKLEFTSGVVSDTIHSITDLVNSKISSLGERLQEILNELKKDKEEFKKLGISFEEKAFYDILVDIRDRNKFEYSNEKCIALAKKIKDLIDNTAIYADWLNNDNLRSQLSCDLAVLMNQEGYPPYWNDEVFEKVLEQVENYKNNQE